MYQTNPPSSPKEILSRRCNLHQTNSQRLELAEKYHLLQPQLLGDTFHPPNYLVQQILVASHVKLYYDPQQTNCYQSPHWFAVVGTEEFYEQREVSEIYRVWREGINPFVVVDFVSRDSEIVDLDERQATGNQPQSHWEVYEQILRIPYYILFDYQSNHLRVFELAGSGYKELRIKEPRIWLQNIQLGLGLWEGVYQGINRQWLRWYDGSLKWIMTHEERERKRAELLKKQLIILGIDDEKGME